MSFAQPPAALLYPHRCTIYRKTESLSATTGEFEGWTGVTASSDVTCYFQTGESVKAPEGFVLDEQDNLFTLDIVHFPSGTDVRTGDILKQTTGPDSNELWEVRGDAKNRTQFASKLTIRAARVPVAPSWVP